jgi:hypothetical protein
MGRDDEERESLLRNSSAPPLPSYQESVGPSYLGSAPAYDDINRPRNLALISFNSIEK